MSFGLLGDPDQADTIEDVTDEISDHSTESESLFEHSYGEASESMPFTFLNYMSTPLQCLSEAESSLCAVSIHPNFPHPPHFAIGGCDEMCRIYTFVHPHSDPVNRNLPPSDPAFTPDFPFAHTPHENATSSDPVTLLQTLDGFKDTISSVAYSACGNYLACGCYDSTIHIYKCEYNSENSSSTPQTSSSDHSINGSASYTHFCILEGPGEEIEWVRWHPRGPGLLCGSHDTSAWLWWVPTQKVMRIFTGHAKGIFHGDFSHDAKAIITGSEDGTCHIYSHSGSKLYEIGTKRSAASIMEDDTEANQSNQKLITSMAVHPSRPLLAIGFEEGLIKVVQTDNGKVLANLNGHTASVETLLFFTSNQGTYFGPYDTLISGGMEGVITYWDIARLSMRVQFDTFPLLLPHLSNSTDFDQLPEEDKPGVIKIMFLSPKLPYLVFTTNSGQIGIIDCRSNTSKLILNAHNGPIWDFGTIQFQNHRTFIISLGEDSIANIWEISHFTLA